ncbi:hypothetical protein [Streptomyces lavendulae]|uniref:hypothetical protein n=1 Tax=Streptomyces lavendulae TaxID=1914 RepID=UPI0031EC5364
MNSSATDEMNSLREEYARLGEDVTGLGDVELLLRELGRTRQESRRHENNYTSLLQDQPKRDRAVRAAAHRVAAEDRRAWAGMYLGHLVSRSAGSINEVIHRAAELPDGRVPVELTRALKEAANRAKWQMSGLVGHGTAQLDEARAQNPSIALVEQQREEILRLRAFVTMLGQELHTEHGGKGTRDNGRRCECSGCELIRSMDEPQAEVEESVPA